jgi:type II secretory pathway pseudopilin PulG
MKNISRSWAMTIVVWAAVFSLMFPGCGGGSDSGGNIKSAVKNSYQDVTAQLDPGGHFYLYASTERIMKTVDEFAVKIRGMIAMKAGQSKDVQKGLQVFDFAHSLIKKSGLMEISGVGVSSIALEEELNHSKIVVHHYKDKSKGIIWNLASKSTNTLDALKMLPGNTVWAAFGEANIEGLWSWLSKEAASSNIPELTQMMPSLEPMLKQKAGIELGKLLASVSGQIGIVVTLDQKNMKAFPMGKQGTLNFPDPAFALLLPAQDDYLFNLLKEKMSFAKPIKKDNMEYLQVPSKPMPITFAPVIAKVEGQLIFATSMGIIDAMLAAKKDGGGLVVSDEFKQLSKEMPAKGNSFRYTSPQFGESVSGVIEKVQASMGGVNKEEQEMFKFMSDFFPKKIAAYEVRQVTDTGFVSHVNHTMGFEYVMMLPAMAVTGIIAAIAIPNLIKATQKGKHKATMGDMKSIGTAIESYITDNYKAPVGQSLDEIQSQLVPFHTRVLPKKDAWGNNYLYKHGTGDKQDTYFIASPGKDGVFNGWEQNGFYPVNSADGINNDIIFSNGNFVYAPRIR